MNAGRRAGCGAEGVTDVVGAEAFGEVILHRHGVQAAV